MSATPLPEEAGLREAHLWSTPIRDLGLTLKGTRLEPIIEEFEAELVKAGFHRLTPRFYLSTEWGVPFETVAIAIPFYLAKPELTEMHARRFGHVEGMSRQDVLKYLRHEMGHVVNYAYRLFEDQEWIRLFGPITRPYREEYHPKPFSRRYVQHLPGWYAQKHPDEDWAETFAVWMTPGSRWREEYAAWPEAWRAGDGDRPDAERSATRRSALRTRRRPGRVGAHRERAGPVVRRRDVRRGVVERRASRNR
jgi:hypothetical protein